MYWTSPRSLRLGLCGLVFTQSCAALQLDVTSQTSINNAAGQVAYGMMKYYHGNETGQTPGLLPQPYYWWETGAMFMTMVDYWYSTGDATYNDVAIEAMCFQASGGSTSFLPANQTTTEGNDDQIFWAYAAMEAAEVNFPAPQAGYPSWLAMAQSVFNQQANRWDDSTCGGGLRWQVYSINSGYDYKNPAANGGFFLLAARLARFTNNETYTDWAIKEWDWFSNSVLLDNTTYQVNDGTSSSANCTAADHQQWSYNYGFYIGGLAFLYNHASRFTWSYEYH
jgi:mannan endo-1,6-alpha-mannosidase